MIFEDGSAPTWAAARRLESRGEELQCPNLRVQPLSEFLHTVKDIRLARAEKELLLDQATVLIDQFYAHLPFKQARYAVDPVREFRLLRAELDHVSDLVFHERLIRSFMSLRDAHTFYGLPAPFNAAFAFLPFRLGSYFDAHGKRRYIVTSVLEGFDHAGFAPGAEIILWRGMSLERAIDREADFEPGCNAASHFVRGLKRLTKRSLAYSPPPDEHYVVVEYHPAADHAERCAITLPWFVASNASDRRNQAGAHSSVNEQMMEMQRLNDLLWRRPGPTASPDSDKDQPRFPQVFEFRYTGGPGGEALSDPEHPERRFSYLRIQTFELEVDGKDGADAFVAEFSRLLGIAEQRGPDGLILDVRSNPGGSIGAAERILQMLTPWEIQPAKFHFINSTLTQQIAFHIRQAEVRAALDANQLEWLPWVHHLTSSVAEGTFITPGEPLTSSDLANAIGQLYTGPVTLLTDAMSYSATDLFAAGFQDHGIGPIIGINESTGGGGANRWLHDELLAKLEKSAPSIHLRPLPRGAQMGFAARRSSRVGTHEGAVIEDEGVQCDILYKLTRDDVMSGDRDLLGFACKQVGALPTGQIRIVKAELTMDAVSLTVESKGLYRIECLLDGSLQGAFPADGQQPFRIPIAGLSSPPGSLRVDGYALTTGSNWPPFQLVARAQIGLGAGIQPDAAASS